MKFLFNGLVAIGLFWGFVAAISLEFYLDLAGSSLEPKGELVAAVLGAAIALSGTGMSLYGAEQFEAERELRRQEALAYSLLIKLLEFGDLAEKLRRHLLDGDPGKSLYVGSDVALRKPMEGSAELQGFSNEELSLLLIWKNRSLFNDLNDLKGLARSLTFMMSRYERDFSKVLNSALEGDEVRTKGRIISSMATINRTDIMYVNSVRAHLDRNLHDCRPIIERARGELLSEISKRFGLAIKMEFDSSRPGSQSA